MFIEENSSKDNYDPKGTVSVLISQEGENHHNEDKENTAFNLLERCLIVKKNSLHCKMKPVLLLA